MAALPSHAFLPTLAAYACICHTPYNYSVAEKGKKHSSAGEDLEAICQDQDSYKQFDCGSDVEMVEDSEESENDSDLDSQIVQIITNLELEDEEQ